MLIHENMKHPVTKIKSVSQRVLVGDWLFIANISVYVSPSLLQVQLMGQTPRGR